MGATTGESDVSELSRVTRGLVIDGETRTARSGETVETSDPSTGSVLATVARSGVDDADDAVAAAGRAFGAWSELRPSVRAALLGSFADRVESCADELARIESRDVGKPISDAHRELEGVVAVLRYYAGAVDKIQGATVPVDAAGLALTLREPLGVVALITPWNFPLAIANWKCAAALAAGNTVVLKPAELAPLSTLRYGELALEAGIPPGVLNVIPGPGRAVGAHLAEHPQVAKIGFTGSGPAGADVQRRAAETVKRLTLELGGKSACVVFADADLDRVGELAPLAMFGNAGQDCCARSRLIVEASIAEELLERYAASTRALRVGDPSRPETEMGPLISAEQRETVDGYVRRGLEQGARLICGGEVPAATAPGGHFYAPTILADVSPGDVVAQEEIFGPVLSVLTFRTEEEAVTLANATPFGLSGSIWTGDVSRAVRVAKAIRTGALSVNGNSSLFPQTPFGGYGRSGVGKELGLEGLLHNTELKSVFIADPGG